MQARAVASALVWARTVAKAEVQTLAIGRKNSRAESEAFAQAQERAEAQNWSWSWLQLWPSNSKEVEAEARVGARMREAELQAKNSRAVSEALEQAQAKSQARASAWALDLELVHKAMSAWLSTLDQVQMQTWQRMNALEACEVEVEYGSWPRHRDDYWWVVKIVTPITRLPSELLHQILLIVIDNDNDSPLLLLRVSRY